MRSGDPGGHFGQDCRVVILLVTFTLLPSALLFAADAPQVPDAPLFPNSDKVALDELFVRLKNPNPAPFIDKNTGGPWEARIPINYDWAGQTGAINAWKELHRRFEEALPKLVSQVNDDAYCFTYVSPTGAERNMSVGKLCEYLIRLNIEIYKRPYFRTHTYQGVLITFDARKQPEYPDPSRAIEIWWSKRKGKSVAELQLEAVQLQLDHFKPAETFEGIPVPKEDIVAIIDSLQSLRKQLLSTGKLDDSIRWRDGDEIGFPSPPKKS